MNTYYNRKDFPEVVLNNYEIRNGDPLYDQILKYRKSIVPILKIIDDYPEYQIIKGTAFFASDKESNYLITARHNLIDKEDIERGDTEISEKYIIGFEGNRINEYFYLTQDVLKEKGLVWKVGKNQEFDLAICKISFSDELLQTLNLDPCPLLLDVDDLLLKPDYPVYSFGYIHGWGNLVQDLEIKNENNETIDTTGSSIMTLLPINLRGRILHFEEDEPWKIISNLAVAHGVSGSPLFTVYKGLLILIGVNVQAPIIRKSGSRRSKYVSEFDQQRYAGKVKSLPMIAISSLIELGGLRDIDAVRIELNDLIVNQRKLDF